MFVVRPSGRDCTLLNGLLRSREANPELQTAGRSSTDSRGITRKRDGWTISAPTKMSRKFGDAGDDSTPCLPTLFCPIPTPSRWGMPISIWPPTPPFASLSSATAWTACGATGRTSATNTTGRCQSSGGSVGVMEWRSIGGPSSKRSRVRRWKSMPLRTK